jgi:hypothetical protein
MEKEIREGRRTCSEGWMVAPTEQRSAQRHHNATLGAT